MKITYGEIPSRDVCIKLSAISFDSPSKNLRVYKFCETLKKHQTFYNNEYNKTLEKYGERQKDGRTFHVEDTRQFNVDLADLGKLEIEGEIPAHGLTEEDFMDERCKYPENKSLWMNAAEIETILEFNKKLKEGG